MVYRPPPPGNKLPPHEIEIDWEWKPGTNVVLAAVPKWLKLCELLDVEAGGQTNLADVDWQSSFKAFAPTSLGTGYFYSIRFKNGTVLQFMDNKVVGHICGDASYVGAWTQKPTEYWKGLVSKPETTWEAMAAALTARLTTKLGVPKALLSGYTPLESVVGSGGVSRCVVSWYATESIGKMPQESIRTAITAEFDLGTKQIKNVMLHDRAILESVNNSITKAE